MLANKSIKNVSAGTSRKMQHAAVVRSSAVKPRAAAPAAFTPSVTPRKASQKQARSAVCQSARSKIQTLEGSLVASKDMKFGVVVGRFNDLVTKLLLEGALEAFERHGASLDNVEVAWVPGCFELPVVAKAMAKSGKFDAVICIGVVVRGATAHYDAVVGAATSGVLNASTDTGVPVVFGVLTCDTMEQAMDRAGGKVGNKGCEAAVTGIEMANLLKSLRGKSAAAGPWGHK